jgi:hypothetical protein
VTSANAGDALASRTVAASRDLISDIPNDTISSVWMCV